MTTAAKKTTAPARRPAARTTAAKAPRRSAVKAPRTLNEFMALALAMETEAAARYAEFADAMEMHNNLEVAALFRKMADIEGRHAAQIMAEMGWKEAPALPPGKPKCTPADLEAEFLLRRLPPEKRPSPRRAPPCARPQ